MRSVRPITIKRQAHRNFKGKLKCCHRRDDDNVLISIVDFCLHNHALNFEYKAILIFAWLVVIKICVLGDAMLHV